MYMLVGDIEYNIQKCKFFETLHTSIHNTNLKPFFCIIISYNKFCKRIACVLYTPQHNNIIYISMHYCKLYMRALHERCPYYAHSAKAEAEIVFWRRTKTILIKSNNMIMQ